MPLIKPGDQVNPPLLIVIASGVFVLAVRVLVWTDTFHSALLYIGVPFGLSLALYYFTPDTDGMTRLRRFWNIFRLSLIIVLASSLALMEGYVCVLMFLPIFLLFNLVAFIVVCIRTRSDKGRIRAYALPVLVALLSLEGTTELTSFDRYNEVTYQRMVQADVARIRERLTRPIEFHGDRHWTLSVFPMPRYVGTVDMMAGDVRIYEFAYHRWIAANTHVGRVEVAFVEVGDTHIRTTITDSSYLSGYMTLRGTEFHLEPISDTQTSVTLTIKFDRSLDPAWYFGPLQRLVVTRGAAYFLDQVLGDQVWDRPQTQVVEAPNA